ncbi:MAG: hypothetical protein ABIQ41_05370 [Gemmatimonadales bacterium]
MEQYDSDQEDSGQEDHYDSDQEEHPYYKGLDEDAIDALNELAPLDVMIFDLKRGIKVTVAFAEVISDNCAATLRAFVIAYPQFGFLINPILEYDPEYASAGEIGFELDGEDVKVKLTLNPMYNTQEPASHDFVMTMKQFTEFVTLTEDFAGFTTGDGEFALNY